MGERDRASIRASAPGSVPVGPYYPGDGRPALYCMLGDEALMFQPAARLNPRQREHWSFMQRDACTYAMAVLPGTRAGDHILLDQQFRQAISLFEWYRQTYAKAGLGPLATVELVDPASIYQRAASAGDEVIKVSICFSYALAEVVELDEQLEVSRRINSKVQLPWLAHRHGFATPRTRVVSLARLRGRDGPRLLEAFDGAPVVKIDGLGGGSNVWMVECHEQLLSFLAPYDDQTMVVLQERLDRAQFTEHVADFVIRETGVHLSNVRLKLTRGSQWLGNVYSPRIVLDEAQRGNLERAAMALRAEGYASEAGYICGFDFFQSERRQLITEINGRWTAGFPITVLLDRLGFSGRQLAVAHYDELPQQEVSAFCGFVEENLAYRGRDLTAPGTFGVFPVSFCPWHEAGSLTVWNLVVGDYLAYREAVVRALGAGVLASSSEVAAMVEEAHLLERFGVGAVPCSG